MSTVAQKPVMYTRSGHPLVLASDPGKAWAADEWLARVGEWRERNRKCVDRISIEEFLADKHAEAGKGLA